MTTYTDDSVTAARLILEDCQKRGQGIEESFRKAIDRLIPAFGPGVEKAVAEGDYGAAYGFQIDHEMRSYVAPEGERTMDSAPKDGTPVLGFVPNYYQGKGGWAVVLWHRSSSPEAGWYDNRALKTFPSCWVPLPPKPQLGEQPKEKL